MKPQPSLFHHVKFSFFPSVFYEPVNLKSSRLLLIYKAQSYDQEGEMWQIFLFCMQILQLSCQKNFLKPHHLILNTKSSSGQNIMFLH